MNLVYSYSQTNIIKSKFIPNKNMYNSYYPTKKIVTNNTSSHKCLHFFNVYIMHVYTHIVC